MKIIKKTIIHRKYPDIKWEFKAVSLRVDDGKIKDVVYDKCIDKGKKSTNVEIYSGRNYIAGSSSPSYSRQYSMKNIPEKYLPIVKKAIKIHEKTKWSKEKYVNKS